jgi:glycyl-tRNA synthetase beta subunit
MNCARTHCGHYVLRRSFLLSLTAGNAAVLRARFEDASFFYNEDLKQPLEAFRCAAQMVMLT